MSGVNKVIIVGRLGADPEMKTIQGGNTVTRLSLATSENWTDKQGQKQERTEWHRVTLWGKQAEAAGKYLTKGRQVYIEGRLQTTSYEKDGVKKYSTEVVANAMQFLGDKPGSGGGGGGQDEFGPEPGFNSTDEIPF